MKNNFFSSKKPKIGFIALLLFFCGLFSQTAVGQTQYNWIKTTGNWETVGNWSITSATTAGSSTTSGTPTVTLGATNTNAVVGAGITGTGIPVGATITAVSSLTLTISSNATATGSVSVVCRAPAATVPGNSATDLAAVTNGGQVTLSSNTTIAKITLSNATGSIGGSRLTISGSTTTLAVTSSNDADLVVLVGGNIVNNGILNISSTFVGATFGMRCGNVPVIAGSLTTYGYSGTGTLSIDTSTCGATSGCILFNGLSTATGITRARYSMTFNSATTTFTLADNTPALRINTGVAATPTYPLPVIIAGTGFTRGTVGSPVTGSLLSLDAGANVTVNSGVTLTLNSAALNASNGIDIGNSNTVYTTSLTNNGTINILGSTTRNGIKVSTYTFSGTPTINTTIVNGGTINVDINANATFNSNEGPAAFAITSGYGVSNANAFLTFTNSGTLNLKNSASGTSIGQAIWVTGAGQRTYATFNNTGTITLEGTASNSGSLSTINNNNTAIINSNNSFSGFAAITNNSGGIFNFTSSSAQTNAIVSPTTNSGTINTGAASDLSVVSGVSAASTGVIDPGGSSRRGIANFSTASTLSINSTLRLQIAADGTAGVNFDRITNSATGGGFNITGAILDVTGIYTPSGVTTIDILTTNATGTLTGSFANVTGLPSGWVVKYTTGTAGKVQLMYGTTWTGGTSTTWTDAANWSNGVPGATTDVVIGTGTFQPAIVADATVKSLTLSALLTINSGTLTVTDAIVNNGSLTIANNASLVQTTGSTYSGSGNTTVTRNSNPLKRLDYTMWSSPVSGTTKTFEQFSPNTSRVPNRFYTYDAANNYYTNVATTSTFTAGLGYLIRMPNEDATSGYNTGGATLAFPGVFTGTSLNNGTINLGTLVANKFYSVGNPYPSPISASSFIAGTSGLGTTLYFWRKTNGTANTLTGSSTGTSYATWTSLGGTASGTVTPNDLAPNGQIAVGQGFIVNTATATTINFTNAMRTSTAATFLKTKAVATTDRVWLNLTNATGAFSQTLIGYTANATLGVDSGIDGEYINDSSLALTSNIDNKEYIIQGRPTFDATDVVALNFKTNVAGDYSIALDHFDGVFAAAQDVYLVDNTTGAETNLKEGAYTFTAAVGTDNTRFSLKYQKTLKVIDAALDNNSVSVYQNNGSIYINSKSAAIRSVKVFDVQGRLIAEQRNVKANTAVFSNLRAKNQLLIVNVIGEDNSEVSKKVMN